MGEMPSFEGAKWKAPKKTPEQPKVQKKEEEEVIELGEADIVEDMGLLGGEEETVPGLEPEEGAEAKKIKVSPEKMPGYMSAGEVAKEGMEEVQAIEAEKFKAVDFAGKTPGQNTKAFIELSLSNPAVLSEVIKLVGPDIKGTKQTLYEAMIDDVKKIQATARPGERQHEQMIKMEKLFKEKLRKLARR